MAKTLDNIDQKSENAFIDHRPIYIQIADDLRAKIFSGQYKDMLDSELTLAKKWGVSRRTIQQSLETLEASGLIRREKGRGTFINKAEVEQGYKSIVSITENITRRGHMPHFDILFSGVESPNQDEQEFFGLSVQDKIYHHKRIAYFEDKPLAVVSTSLNPKQFPDLDLSKLDGSLYHWLRNRYQSTIIMADDQYFPQIADKETANFLKIKIGSPIFLVERRAVDQQNINTEYSKIKMLPIPLEVVIRNRSQIDAKTSLDEWLYQIGFGAFV